MIHYLPHRQAVHRSDYSPPSTHARAHAHSLSLVIIHVYISCRWFVPGWKCWKPGRGPLTWNLQNDSWRATLLNIMTRRREIKHLCKQKRLNANQCHRVLYLSRGIKSDALLQEHRSVTSVRHPAQKTQREWVQYPAALLEAVWAHELFTLTFMDEIEISQ